MVQPILMLWLVRKLWHRCIALHSICGPFYLNYLPFKGLLILALNRIWLMTLFKTAAVLATIGVSACNSTIGVSSGGVGVSASATPQTRTGARTFIASNRMVVYGDPSVPGRFEVQQRAARGASDYWCAAGEYAIQSLGVSPVTRVYVETPYGEGFLSSSGKTAGFTVNPSVELKDSPAAQSNGINMGIKRVGENWSAEHGRIQCPPPFFFDFWY